MNRSVLRILNICMIIAMIMSLPILAAGAYFSYFITAGFVETQAVVDHIDYSDAVGTEDDTTYAVYVRHELDGHDYIGSIGYYGGTYQPGQKMTAWYDPGQPDRIRVKDSKIGRMILFSGAFSFLLPLFLLILLNLKARYINRYS